MLGRILFGLTLLFFTASLFASTGLRDYQSPNRLAVGAAARSSIISNSSESLYRTTLAREYNMITPENELKWKATEPAQNKFNFSSADVIATFALKNGMKIRGHNLLWGLSNPTWLTQGQYSATQLQSIMENHISKVMTHYRTQFPGIVTTWDVVNELINAGPGIWTPLGKSTDKVTQAFNIASIALKAARAADPSAKLCINEYSLERNGSATNTYKLVSRLKKAGIPLDCVGFQGHLSTGSVTKSQWIASLTAFAKLGVEVHITEFDATNAPPAQYSNAINACLSVPQCKAFITWGFTDKYTWRGTAAHPLPFDEKYNKKPAYDTLKNALATN